MKVVGSGPFTKRPGDVWRLPVAHAEGRYQATDAVLKQLEDADAVALRYCDASGDVTDRANPNGSVANIAGIYAGAKKNVFGLMPHPERMSESALGGVDGRALFESVLAAS